MKKSLLFTALMLLALLTGCTFNSSNKEKVQIGIIQPVEHPSLNQIRESIIKNLEEQGVADKINVVYKDAQGDPSNINTIASQFAGEMDIIVPIGTTAAQTVAATTSDIPIIFAAVSYPVEAGLVKNLNQPEKNITGVSDSIDVKQIFDLALEITPDIKTFGLIYNSGEVNSAAAIANAKNYLTENNINYLETTITNSSELLQASLSLLAKVDAVFTPTDNTVATAMPVLAAEAIKAGIPVYTGADSLVEDGGLATVGVDYTILGRQVANMIKRVIENENISNISVESLDKYSKIINLETAKQIGIELSEEKLKEFKVVK